MTQITEKQYKSLKQGIYMTLISSQYITEGGEVCERGMGEMGECDDAAQLIIDDWMKEENIELVEEITVPQEVKKFEVYYCYGGQYKGDCKMKKVVEATNEQTAREAFIKVWRYEEIYSITEVANTTPTTKIP